MLLGEIFVNPTTNYCYVPLLKNAHLWGEKTFSELGFVRKRYKFDDKKTYIIFLRDPIDRWLSGMAEYLNILKNDGKFQNYMNSRFKLDVLHLDFIFTKITFDDHTLRQVDYLQKYNYKVEFGKCYYFYMNDDNFASNVEHFIYKTFNQKISKSIFNSIKENKFKKAMRKQLESTLLTNKDYENNIKKYFQEDYDFIKKCHFYTIHTKNVLNATN